MQRNISNKIQLGNTLNLLQDYGGIPAVDNVGNLENVYSNVDKIGAFWKTGKADEDSKYSSGRETQSNCGDYSKKSICLCNLS